MLDSLLRTIIAFGAGLTFLLAISQLFVVPKTRRNWLFFLFYLCISVLMLTSYNIKENLTMVFPGLSLVEVPFLFLMGPCMYNMFSEPAHTQKSGIRFWAHFIAPALALIVLSPYFLIPSEDKANRVLLLFEEQSFNPYEALFAVGLLSMVIYLGVMFHRMRRVWTVEFFRNEWIVRQLSLLLAFSMLAVLLALFGVLSLDFTWLRITMATTTLMVCAVFLIGHRYPSFFHTFTILVQQSKYKKSYLQGDDAKYIQAKLKAAMEQDKVFLEDNLSLMRLAEKLGVTAHQLSQYLNVHEQKNFSTYINEFRVNQALTLLKEDPDVPVLSVGYKVGFNSKSSFSRAFRIVTGITPNEFRKKKRAPSAH